MGGREEGETEERRKIVLIYSIPELGKEKFPAPFTASHVRFL